MAHDASRRIWGLDAYLGGVSRVGGLAEVCGRAWTMGGRAWSGLGGMLLMAREECRCEGRHGEMESGHHLDSFACMGNWREA